MPALTHGDGQDLLASFKRGWERRDPDALMILFNQDAEFRPAPFADELVGANAIRAHWNAFSAEQLHVEFDAERIWVAGSTVLASWHGAHTRRRTSERVRVRGFLTIEVDDDRRIVRMRQWPSEVVVGLDSTVRPEGGVLNGR